MNADIFELLRKTITHDRSEFGAESNAMSTVYEFLSNR